MLIIAHRGLWTSCEEGNTIKSFQAAFKQGYGIETDIRDYSGKLVVAHNVPDEPVLLFDEVLRLYSDMGSSLPIAINIKADGLQKLLKKALEKYNVSNYFVFDMSIPEQVVFCRDTFPVFTRMSEYETIPVLLERAQGIWMDEWERAWINADIIRQYRNAGKTVAIISPEIHGRDVTPLWNSLKEFINDNKVILCTDTPQKAEGFFYEGKN